MVQVGDRLVEVQVRESPRSRLLRAVYRQGEPPELVVPVGTSERAIDRALRMHAPWLERQLATEQPRAHLAMQAMSEARVGSQRALKRAGLRRASRGVREREACLGVEGGRLRSCVMVQVLEREES